MHGKVHASCINCIHAEGMRFFASVLKVNVAVHLFFLVEHDSCLFDVVVVIAIERGDHGHSCLTDCLHPKSLLLLT